MHQIILNRQDFNALSDEVLNQGGYLHFRARGSSMYPVIRDGDFLTVQPVEPSKLKTGDVAFYRIDGGQLIAHRVVGKCAQHSQLVLKIRGNASFCQDEMVPASQILGRVMRLQREEKMIQLDRWRWQLKSVLWAKFPALCFMPYRLMRKSKKNAAAILHRVQALPLYRLLGRRFATYIAIAEASAVDMEKVYRHFNMTEPNFAQPPDPNVTNWVAKRGQKVVGFVQLVRHPPEHHPWIGHWLFSLEVWKCYRGLGIGERLTQLVIAQVITEGAPELLLAVFQDNARAICLYRKLGFEQVTLPALEPHLEAEKQQFGRRRIVMRKIIAKQPV